MKQLLAGLLSLFSCFGMMAQKIDSAAMARLEPAQREEVNMYLSQAKRALIPGVILCSAGGAMSVIGGSLLLEESLEDDLFAGWGTDEGNPDYTTTGTVLLVAGIISMAVSIPLFVKAHDNRKKARVMVFGDQGVTMSPRVMLPHTASAGIKLVIPINK